MRSTEKRATIKRRELSLKTEKLSIKESKERLKFLKELTYEDYLSKYPQIDKFNIDNNFNLYQNMKYNIKNSTSTCEIHDSNLNIYCLTCKRSICEICKETFHNNHLSIKKKEVTTECDFIKAIFKKLEDNLNAVEALVQPKKLIETYKANSIAEFNVIYSKIDELKEKRLKEIENMFGGSFGNSNSLISIVKKTKENLIKYFEKYNKDFLNTKEINDDDNIIFLHTYDIINDCIKNNLEYNSLTQKIKTDYIQFSKGTECKYDNIIKEIEICLAMQKRSDINQANLMILEAEDGKFEKREEFKQKLSIQFEKLNEDLYSETRKKLEVFETHYDNFKTFVYDSFKKNGNSLVEIDKIIKAFEEKMSKKINYSGNAGLKLSFSTKSKNCRSRVSKNSSPSSSAGKKISGNFYCNANVNNNYSSNTEAVNTRKDHKNLYENVIKECIDSKASLDSSKNNSTNRNINKPEFNFEDKDDFIVDLSGQNNNISNNNDVHNKNNNYSKFDKMFRPKPNKIFTKQSKLNNNTINIKNIKNTDKDKTTVLKATNNLTKPNTTYTTTKNNSKDNLGKVNQKLLDNLKEIELQSELIKKKDDISLKVPILRKYYSYSTLDYIHKTQFAFAKSGCSSTNLLFDNNFFNNNSNNLRNTAALDSYFKIIEGTNELQYYSKSKKKIIKKRVTIDKLKFNTTVFPSGSKSVLYNNNIYISGGRDLLGPKSLFWCYSIKDNKLSKLQDSKYTHSYHSIIYHDNLRSIIIFGGENSCECEMFDLALNLWSSLPQLNVPRAKINLYIDRLGVYVYAIFGILGEINKGLFSDAIEVIDLIDPSKGWAKIEYNNKSFTDIKRNSLKVSELSGDKILLYGAIESRDYSYCHLIFDLKNFDLRKIDKDELDIVKAKLNLPIEVLIQTNIDNSDKKLN